MRAEAKSNKFPPQIKFLVGNELCERFSFYGMRAILSNFMVHYLLFTEANASATYHLFVMGCYLMPLAGGYLSDRFFGKYQTILWLSIVYCFGHAALAMWENEFGLYLGLALIAVGSGGIKPCVSAFGGEQFRKDQPHLIRKFYDVFYFTINFGSLFSYLTIPVLRDQFGYGVAFGIPGILMAIATLVFWMGRKKYVYVPPTGPNPNSVPRVLWTAFQNSKPGVPFLEGARRKHGDEAVEGVHAVWNIVKVYLAVSLFWALFDQKGSTWIFQANKMDHNFLGLTLKPAMMQFLNPLLVMIFIPVLAKWVYPWIQKSYDLRPLRKMGWGMVIAGFAFVQSGVIQYMIESGETLNIAWQAIPYATITLAEVLISVTGLAFAYTQAPKSMKSVIMSFWMMTTALGNLFASIIAKVKIFEGGDFFMFFAVMMFLAAGIFAFFAKRYQGRDYN